jgi:hypothetical protein
MSKGGSQTQTTSLDPQSQAYVNQMRQLALGYAGLPGTPGGALGAGAVAGASGGGPLSQLWNSVNAAGHPPAASGIPSTPPLPAGIQSGIDQYNQYGRAGSLGLSALTGDQQAFQQFQNPYQQTLDPIWAQIRAQSVNAANDQATMAGAYGGGRGDVAQGVALGQVANAQGQQQYQSFLDAMQRAGYAANLGFGANAAAGFLPQQYQSGQLGLLNQALGPYGQTSSTQNKGGDPFSQLLGLGIKFGPAIFGIPPIAGGL